MRKFFFLFFLLFPVIVAGARQQDYDVTVTSVMVPVRVYSGTFFVENLGIEDFTLLEEGEIRPVEALYLVKDGKIDRQQVLRQRLPQLSKNFTILILATDFHPGFRDAFAYFFNNIYREGDSMTLVTPMKVYSLSPSALKVKSNDRLSREIQLIIQRDITAGGSNYTSLISELKRLVNSISVAGGAGDPNSRVAGIDEDSSSASFDINNIGFLLSSYRNTIERIESLRFVEEEEIIDFARGLKAFPGDNNVIFIYEREYRPEINENTLTRMLSLFQEDQDIVAEVQSLFSFYNQNVTFDIERILRAFADSSALFHFIFLDKDRQQISGINMREQSQDIHRIFQAVAQQSGGHIDLSGNLSNAFSGVKKTMSSYYLLYYTSPKSEQKNDFRRIEVRMKDPDYKISYRRGYYAGSGQIE